MDYEQSQALVQTAVMKGIKYITFSRVVKESIILISAAVILAFGFNAFSSKGIALFGEWDKKQGVVTPKSKNDVVDHDLEIESVQAAKRIFDTGNAAFVDARSEDQYREGHIKGAVMLPVNEFDNLIGDFQEQYPEDTFIVTYCSGRECEDSHRLAQYLFESGYWNVSVFIDGLPAWKSEGYPIERGNENNTG